MNGRGREVGPGCYPHRQALLHDHFFPGNIPLVGMVGVGAWAEGLVGGHEWGYPPDPTAAGTGNLLGRRIQGFFFPPDRARRMLLGCTLMPNRSRTS